MTITAEYSYDELCEQYEELCQERNEFCAECEDVYIAYESLEHFGSLCARQEVSCPADFEPNNTGCPRHREYIELGREREQIDAQRRVFEEEDE